MTVSDFVNDPTHKGPLDRFTHQGLSGEPGNGAFTQMWLRIENGQVAQCNFETHGCIWSIACASVCARLATGRPLEKALLIEPSDIDLILGGIPEGKGEYANMAVTALRSALGGN